MSFETELERGRAAEKLVADWFMIRNCRVLPVYDFSGLSENKAPRLMAVPTSSSLVMPDLLVACRGKLQWVEVKLKTEATLYRKTGVLETGLNLRLWKHYAQVQEISGVLVWIVFMHEKEDSIVVASLNTLMDVQREYHGEKMGRGGMVFFPYEKFRVLASLSTEREKRKPRMPPPRRAITHTRILSDRQA